MLTKCMQLLVVGLLSVNVATADELTVSAAASLNNAFTELAKQYEAKHPDTKIRFNFAASGTLLQQIDKGAPVDIFASADQQTMDQAAQKKLINAQSRVNFINNSLVVITPINAKEQPTALEQLSQAAIHKIAIGNPAYVPAGNYTEQVLKQAKLWDTLQDKVIFTQNVRQALDYVATGEVEAGFVYGSDAAVMPTKVKVAFEVPTVTPISYPIAIIEKSQHQQQAQAFINFILSDESQQVLVHYGFQKK